MDIPLIWGILRHTTTLSASHIFVSSFQILIPLISVSNLIALARTPKTILKNNGNNRHPCFIFNLQGSKYDGCWFGISFTALRKCPSISIFLNKFIYLFIYFWLCWVFVAARGLSLVAASGGYSSLQCAGFSLRWLLLLQSTGSRHTGSVVVACRL